MAQGEGTRPRRARPPRRVRWWQLALAGAALAVVVLGQPLWLWLTVWPPAEAQRREALAAVHGRFPIHARDAAGAEHRVLWADLTGHAPGPCQRDLTLWNPDGPAPGGPLRARMVVDCLELLDHPALGRLRAVVRHESGRPGFEDLRGARLAARLAGLDR